MEFVSGLRLLDAVVLLKDRLDELFEADQVPEKTYNRKASFRQLLRAVNKADRMVCSVRKKVQPVALYLPKGIHLFPLDSHAVFAGQQIASVVKSALMQKHPAGIQVFINEQPWVEIAGIESEYAQVYKEHPTHTVSCDRQIKRVNLTALSFDARHGCVFTYDTENRVLHLSEPFSTDIFLVFEARLRPGKIDVRKYDAADVHEAEDTELAEAMITTPHHFEDTLLTVALSKLLTVQADMITEQDIIAMTSGQEDANGPSFISPGRMYPAFGVSEW